MGVQAHAPQEICKIRLSKMQLSVFPEPELGNWNYDRNHLFSFQSYALYI